MKRRLTKKISLNESGQALMQVLTATALIALLAMSVGQISSNVNAVSRRTNFQNNIGSAVVMVRTTLSSRDLAARYLDVNDRNDVLPSYGTEYTDNKFWHGASPSDNAANPVDKKIPLEIVIPFYDDDNNPNNGNNGNAASNNGRNSNGIIKNLFPGRATGPPTNKVRQNAMTDLGLRVDDLYFKITKNKDVPISAPYIPARQHAYEGVINILVYSSTNPRIYASREIGKFTCIMQVTAPPIANYPIERAVGELVTCFAEESDEATCNLEGCFYDPTAPNNCNCGLPPCNCSDLGPDFYVSGRNPDGGCQCDKLDLRCPQTGGNVNAFMGIKVVGSWLQPDCKRVYTSSTSQGAYIWRPSLGPCSEACGTTGVQSETSFQCIEVATNLPVDPGPGTCAIGSEPAPKVGLACNRYACDCVANLEWTVGANTCTVTGQGLANGSTLVVNDNLGPTRGSAEFMCVDGIPQATAPPSVPQVCAPYSSTGKFFASGVGCGACPGATSVDRVVTPTLNATPATSECWSVIAGDQVRSEEATVGACPAVPPAINIKTCSISDTDTVGGVPGVKRAGRFSFEPGVGGWYSWSSHLSNNFPGGAVCEVEGTSVSWQIASCENWDGAEYLCLKIFE